MTLLFEDAGIKKRKFQCFVCGKNYETIESMNEHILLEHDEGREFIKCPTCNYCVRDLKTHFSVKHPNRMMPSGVQTRVGIWHDFKPGKDGKQNKTTRKVKFRSGTFSSIKCGKDFQYRSGMECEFYALLESDLDVISFDAEPFKIPYFHKGDWHNYLPDIRVNFVDGSTEIWEIKPANQTHYEQNKCKWAAANNFCSNLGWGFVVLTEVGLGKLKTKLKQQQLMTLLESERQEHSEETHSDASN